MATEKNYFDDLNVGDAIIQGLEDCIAFEKGDTSRGRKTVHSIPDPHYKPDEITQLRKSLNMTQRGMAHIVGVSPRTVEGWEIGRTIPSGAAQRLLYLMEKDHSIVDRLTANE